MHERRDVFGQFVICPGCDRHFEWGRVLPGEPKPDQPPRDGEWNEDPVDWGE